MSKPWVMAYLHDNKADQDVGFWVFQVVAVQQSPDKSWDSNSIVYFDGGAKIYVKQTVEYVVKYINQVAGHDDD